jgi:hypothetical protein
MGEAVDKRTEIIPDLEKTLSRISGIIETMNVTTSKIESELEMVENSINAPHRLDPTKADPEAKDREKPGAITRVVDWASSIEEDSNALSARLASLLARTNELFNTILGYDRDK